MFLPAILVEGARIGNCRVERKLGKGGFGITYLATEYTSGDAPLRKVAIKEFFPHGIAMRDAGNTVTAVPNVDGADEAFSNGLKAFYREAQAIAALDHENIIRLHSVFEANGTAYFVMPFLKGESLRHLLRREGRLAEARLRQLLIPVLDGLSHAHDQKLLHRDIKPDNLMVREDNGRCVLIDFGTARAEAVNETERYTRMTDLVAYTPGYAALEQYSRAASGNRHGAWTDLYAFGAVMAEAMTGRAPPESALRAADVHGGHEDPMVPVSVTLQDAPGYSRAMLFAVDWALELSAKNRPQSIAEFREAIDGRRMPPDATLRRLEAYGVATEPLTVPGVAQPDPLAQVSATMRSLQDITRSDPLAGVSGTRRSVSAASEPDTLTRIQPLSPTPTSRAPQTPKTLPPQEAKATLPPPPVAKPVTQRPAVVDTGPEVIEEPAPSRRGPLIGAAVAVLIGGGLILTMFKPGSQQEPPATPATPVAQEPAVAPEELRKQAGDAQLRTQALVARATKIVKDYGGQPDVILAAAQQQMSQAQQALGRDETGPAMAGFERAEVAVRSTMQAFIQERVAAYGELANKKMAADDLEAAQAALTKARKVEGLAAEFR